MGGTWVNVSPFFNFRIIENPYKLYVHFLLVYFEYYQLQLNEIHSLNFKDLKKFKKGYEIKLLNTVHKDIRALMSWK